MTKNIFLSLVFLLFCSNYIAAQSFKQYKNAADKAFENASYYEAISYYKQALTFSQNTDEIRFKMGLAELELKNYSGALKHLNKVKNKKEHPLIDYKIGQCQILTGEYEAAITSLTQFKNSYNKTDALLKDAVHKIASCHWAKDHLEAKTNISIEAMDKDINSEYSEFAAGYFKDSVLQITSFFQEKKKKKNDYKSDILFFEKEDIKHKQLDIFFDKESKLERANGFYLAEKKRFYFNQCEKSIQGNKRCDLYVTEFKDSAWQKPIKLNINDANFTTTQACAYVNKAGEDVLFFVSDRTDGLGNRDIWTTKETSFGVFETPKQLSKKVNTAANESSPFYDKTNDILYFSSDGHYGFGGQDIFKIDLKNNTTAKNLGRPYNSCSNDVYYIKNNENEGFISSNREDALKLKKTSCCYDIYTFKESKIEEDTTSTIDSIVAETPTDSSSYLLEKIREMLPLTVYFHNDEPNPKTRDTTTTLTYTSTYKNYIALKETYVNENNAKNIEAFFSQKLRQGYTDLKAFEKLLTNLISKHKIIVELSGYCSPLAKNNYNTLLAKRRISSLKNELMLNKTLKSAFENNQLVLKEVAYGEEKASSSTSDNYYKPKESIYSTSAALERKVSIVGIILE